MKFLFALPFVIFCLPAQASTQEDMVATYQKYEHAYLANNAKELERWLAPTVDLSETLHVGDKSETRRASREQFLDRMNHMGRPQSNPQSAKDAIVISDVKDASFCAAATVTDQATVKGQKYDEREVRKVCFARVGDADQVTSHSTDIYYTPAK